MNIDKLKDMSKEFRDLSEFFSIVYNYHENKRLGRNETASGYYSFAKRIYLELSDASKACADNIVDINSSDLVVKLKLHV